MDLPDDTDDGEHLNFGSRLQDDGRVVWIGRMQLDVVLEDLQDFAGRLIAVPNGNHQVIAQWPHGAVNHEYVAVTDPNPLHRPAACAIHEGGWRITHQQPVQVYRVFHEVIGRRWEAEHGACACERHSLRLAIDSSWADVVGDVAGSVCSVHARILVVILLTGYR